MIYDRFQQEAIDHIKSGHSVIVSAPTGAGKTVIAEHVINDCLATGKRVVYTAPIKALSNQKYRDFQAQYADKVGILTGDVSINAHAPVLIMTTEIFRNKILTESSGLEEYSWIIFDEIHYIDDFERGTVWEECLIFLPDHMKMLALSATIPNIDEFAEWIHSIHGKELKVIKEEKRPVPLHFFYQCEGMIFDNVHKLRELGYSGKKEYFYRRGKRFTRYKHLKPNRLDKLINHLQASDKLPCIYFAFGRKRCEYLADEMRGFDFLDKREKGQITKMFSSLCARFDLDNEKSAYLLLPLIERGIAYHHAGMLPTLKEVIERLFTSRLLKVIFTTETFALGINMPARTVVFDELRKFYGRYFANLKTRDFYQMAGRAGRRGIDKEGFVYSRVNLNYISLEELKRIIFSDPEKVRSRFNASYATLINLYERYGDDLYEIYPRSFHHYQEKSKSQKRALDSMRSKVDILKELGYLDENGPTEKGTFASKIYGYELSMSEMYQAGILEGLSETELATLALALVYEPRKGQTKTAISKKARHLKALTDEIISMIHRKEKHARVLPLSKDYRFHLSACIEAWMDNESFDKILSHTDADEGELIRYFRMAVQIFREVLDTPASPDLKNKIRKTISLINRGVVDAENQLRIQ